MDKGMPLKPHDENIPDSTVKCIAPSRLPTPMMKRPTVLKDAKMIQDVKRCRLDLSDHSEQNHSSRMVGHSSKNPRAKMRRSKSLVSVNRIGTAQSLRALPVEVKASRPPSGNTSTSKTLSSTAIHRAPSMNNISNGKAQTTASCIKSVSAPGKRPAWDLKGRLEDTEHLIQAMSAQMTAWESKNIQLKERAVISDREVIELRTEIVPLRTALHDTKKKLADKEESHALLESQYKEAKLQLECANQKCMTYETTIAQLTGAQAGITAQLNAAKVQMDSDAERISRLMKIIVERDASIKQLRCDLEQKEHKIRSDETERRRLHNTIQELKGNIRVFCRVRPLLNSEVANSSRSVSISYPSNDHQVMELCSLDASKGRGMTKHEFKFDQVFPPQATQETVFDEISQLVQSALDGYNVCVFAYGQTGSGKTYTMEGLETCSPEHAGMIPRAVEQIFQSIENLKCQGWEYEMEATFLEVYNETIRDLLGNGKDDLKHEIKMLDCKGGDVYVSNITPVRITSEDQVFKLLIKAHERRAVAATSCNDRSSRSHSVFKLRLSGCNEGTGESCQGTLNLVDLAGSERLKETQSEGQRLREAKNINKSLSNLGNVILALGQKAEHIPYRSSKLTHLLMNSLGGNSKTLMFVNVSPKEEHLNETLNSLRFATKVVCVQLNAIHSVTSLIDEEVNQCNIGTAQRKVK